MKEKKQLFFHLFGKAWWAFCKFNHENNSFSSLSSSAWLPLNVFNSFQMETWEHTAVQGNVLWSKKNGWWQLRLRALKNSSPTIYYLCNNCKIKCIWSIVFVSFHMCCMDSIWFAFKLFSCILDMECDQFTSLSH